MDRAVVEQYLARAAAAASVRELHAIARDVRRAHAGDPDAERVEQACWTAALRVVAAPPVGRPRLHLRPDPRAPTDSRVDWKERAASA